MLKQNRIISYPFAAIRIIIGRFRGMKMKLHDLLFLIFALPVFIFIITLYLAWMPELICYLSRPESRIFVHQTVNKNLFSIYYQIIDLVVYPTFFCFPVEIMIFLCFKFIYKEYFNPKLIIGVPILYLILLLNFIYPHFSHIHPSVNPFTALDWFFN